MTIKNQNKIMEIKNSRLDILKDLLSTLDPGSEMENALKSVIKELELETDMDQVDEARQFYIDKRSKYSTPEIISAFADFKVEDSKSKIAESIRKEMNSDRHRLLTEVNAAFSFGFEAALELVEKS